MTWTTAQFGTYAAILSMAAYIPYAWAVLRGQARPQRASWLIWAVLSSIAVTSVLSSGGSQGLVFTGAQMAGTCGIFLLSLWRGTGSLAHRRDAGVLGGAVLGLLLWGVTDDPRWAMGLSIAVGTLGGTLTLSKAYAHPASEALLPWALQCLAALCGVVSVLGGTAMEMAYPLYLAVLYSGIVIASAIGKGTSPAGGTA